MSLNTHESSRVDDGLKGDGSQGLGVCYFKGLGICKAKAWAQEEENSSKSHKGPIRPGEGKLNELQVGTDLDSCIIKLN